MNRRVPGVVVRGAGSVTPITGTKDSGRNTRYPEVIPVLCPSMDVRWRFWTSFHRAICPSARRTSSADNAFSCRHPDIRWLGR